MSESVDWRVKAARESLGHLRVGAWWSCCCPLDLYEVQDQTVVDSLRAELESVIEDPDEYRGTRVWPSERAALEDLLRNESREDSPAGWARLDALRAAANGDPGA